MLLTEIAAHLGVSITTVSLVLNGKSQQGRISDSVAQRVLAYVEEVGYKPNQSARSLRTGKTGLIGLLVENIADPLTGILVSIIESQAFEHGYQLVYGASNADAVKARRYLAMFCQRQVDAYIIAPCLGIEEELSAIRREGVPLILLSPEFASEAF